MINCKKMVKNSLFSLILLGALQPVAALAETFVVTNSADDGTAGDTLREIILDLSNDDTICFELGSASTISLLSPLPPITASGITVDGFCEGSGTESIVNCGSITPPNVDDGTDLESNIVVIIDGSSIDPTTVDPTIGNYGLYFTGTNGIVRGVQIQNFDGGDGTETVGTVSGIRASNSATGLCVECSIIENITSNATGSEQEAYGVRAAEKVTNSIARNVSSDGNQVAAAIGIQLANATGGNALVQGSLVTSIIGGTTLFNDCCGDFLFTAGIHLLSVNNGTVQNNKVHDIQTNNANNAHGVVLQCSNDNLIINNQLFDLAGSGVFVGAGSIEACASVRNTLHTNSIYNVAIKGITLEDGAGTDDTLAGNNAQVEPEILRIVCNSNGTITIELRMCNTLPSSTFDIQFFASTISDPAQGQTPISLFGDPGLVVSSNINGNVKAKVTFLPIAPVSSTDAITSLATVKQTEPALQRNGNTSEFGVETEIDTCVYSLYLFPNCSPCDSGTQSSPCDSYSWLWKKVPVDEEGNEKTK